LLYVRGVLSGWAVINVNITSVACLLVFVTRIWKRWLSGRAPNNLPQTKEFTTVASRNVDSDDSNFTLLPFAPSSPGLAPAGWATRVGDWTVVR
jgi:hypothetical protein